MKNSYDLVIVGAGVMGCATAYHLANRGMTNILVVDKNTISSGATGRCGGGIRQQWGAEVNIKLAMDSRREFATMQEEFGWDIEYRQGGYLILAFTGPEAARYKTNVELQRSLGLSVELLDAREAKEIVPELNTGRVLAATFCQTDGSANPFLVTHAYADAARKLGVEVSICNEVTGIECSKGRVVAVQTRSGKVCTPRVFNAAGGAAGTIGAMAGVDIPVEPYRREILVTEQLERFFDPMIISFDYGIYFRQAACGAVMGGFGDPDQRPGPDVTSSLEFLQTMAGKLVDLMPCLSAVRVVRQWAGLYCMSPDAQPIIGAVSEPEGYYQAIGFSGHGFMIAPALAALMSELITEDRTSRSIEELTLQRFSDKSRLHTEKSVV
ncbi:MAG: FAD-binding oxidoreductase [bacterium]|nr:FAD-binding oxidoreductase [bacterium]